MSLWCGLIRFCYLEGLIITSIYKLTKFLTICFNYIQNHLFWSEAFTDLELNGTSYIQQWINKVLLY